MNRKDLARRLAKETGLFIKECEAIVDALPVVIEEGLREDGKVSINNFISLRYLDVKEKAIGDFNGGTMVIPAHKRVKISIADSFKKKMQE